MGHEKKSALGQCPLTVFTGAESGADELRFIFSA